MRLRWTRPWLALLACALPLPPVAAAQGASRSFRAEQRLAVGSDLWFGAVFKLTNPVEGGQLQFSNQHLAFRLNALRFRVPLTEAAIRFSRADSAAVSPLAGGQWVSQLPLTFEGPLFPAGLSWDVATNLAGGITQTRSANLLVVVGAPTRRKSPRRE